MLFETRLGENLDAAFRTFFFPSRQCQLVTKLGLVLCIHVRGGVYKPVSLAGKTLRSFLTTRVHAPKPFFIAILTYVSHIFHEISNVQY
jgi:hypothetical protein